MLHPTLKSGCPNLSQIVLIFTFHSFSNASTNFVIQSIYFSTVLFVKGLTKTDHDNTGIFIHSTSADAVFLVGKKGLQACNFIKKRLQHRCLPVNIAKNSLFYRTPMVTASVFFKEHFLFTAYGLLQKCFQLLPTVYPNHKDKNRPGFLLVTMIVLMKELIAII